MSFFKNYGVMMAQAIYTTFCHAFPTSYRQFNGDFRDEILSLCLLWTMGKYTSSCQCFHYCLSFIYLFTYIYPE